MDIDQVRAQLPGTAPALLRYARLLTGDEHDAADLVLPHSRRPARR